ncbi:SRPBCC domain-containing protein [Labrenzia sp. CE80]|uniref:SRPBCC family protein n=1 Tax=Labrenzia sp. CE80 TaxID=1788986 RepID=UPI00129A295A|nr:SRPBCC domain-containing protein [Labrenzia sp. CE80]
MTDTTIVKTVFFAAPPETVWAFLTQKSKLEKWFHPASSDLVQGEDYALLDRDTSEKLCWGTVLEMEPVSRLVWSFTVKPLCGAMTTVIWALDEVEGGTKLTLRHEGVEAAAGEASMTLLTALDKGWDAHFGALRESIA